MGPCQDGDPVSLVVDVVQAVGGRQDCSGAQDDAGAGAAFT